MAAAAQKQEWLADYRKKRDGDGGGYDPEAAEGECNSHPPCVALPLLVALSFILLELPLLSRMLVIVLRSHRSGVRGRDGGTDSGSRVRGMGERLGSCQG